VIHQHARSRTAGQEARRERNRSEQSREGLHGQPVELQSRRVDYRAMERGHGGPAAQRSRQSIANGRTPGSGRRTGTAYPRLDPGGLPSVLRFLETLGFTGDKARDR
jgi:hypothetical protein